MKSNRHSNERKSGDAPEIVYESISSRQPELTAAVIAHVVQAILNRPAEIDLPVIA